MTRDELRTRLSGLADGVEVNQPSPEAVMARGRLRVRRQRAMAVAATFVIVVGVAGMFRAIGTDGDTLDVAIAGDEPEATDSADGTSSDDQGGDEAGSTDDAAESVSVESTSSGSIGIRGFGDDSIASDYGGNGPNWVLPWGDGFVAFGQVWHASTATVRDLLPDIEDRFPQEILDAWAEAGVADGASIDELSQVLVEAELFELATEIVQNDPELLDAYMAATGGTYSFEVQVSENGSDWTDLADFSVPGGNDNFGFVQSDGVHLVVGSQHWIEDGGAGDISVSITSDLRNWVTVEVPVDEPTDIPPFAHAGSNLGALAIGPNGFLVTVQTHSWVDLWALLPTEIINEIEENGWGFNPSPEGLRLESYADYGMEIPVADGEDGAAMADSLGSSLSSVDPWEPSLERLVPWSEVGINYDTYEPYFGNTATSQVWVGSWDGQLAAATAPGVSNCCMVVGTEAGYLATAWDEYEYEQVGRSLLFFSADGHSWEPVAIPPSTEWIDGVASVAGGVLLSTSHESGQSHWRGGADGADWELVEIPVSDDTYLWFGQGSGDGVAATIDIAEYSYDEPPLLVGLEAHLENDGYTAVAIVGEDGFARITITDPSGALVYDEPGDWEIRHAGGVVEQLYLAGDNLREGSDDSDFFEGFDAESEELWDQLNAFEEEFHAASGYETPIYMPDMLLVASVDGLNWYVEDLPDPADGAFYYSTPAMNGTRLTLRSATDWITFDLD